jgi:hypothetical protein
VAASVPELMGSIEVAALLGWAHPTNVDKIEGLPDPVARVNRDTRIWLGAEVREFARRRSLKTEPRCHKHGKRYMRVPPSGRAYCAKCSKERRRRWGEQNPERKRAQDRERSARIRAERETD